MYSFSLGFCSAMALAFALEGEYGLMTVEFVIIFILVVAREVKEAAKS